MGAKKAEAVESETAVNLENTIEPSEKRKRTGQVQDALHATIASRSGMKTRNAAEIAIHRKIRLKAQLNAVWGISADAAAKPEEAAEMATGKGEMRVEAQLDAESSIRINAAGSRLEELTAGMVSQRDEALLVAADRRTESESVQKKAENETTKSVQKKTENGTTKTNRGTSIRSRHRNQGSELNEPAQKDEKTELHSEFDVPQIAKQAGKSEGSIKLAKQEKQSVPSEGKHDVTMHALAHDHDEVQVSPQCQDKLRLEKTLSALECRKRKVEQDLIVMEKEAEERRKHQRAHKKELDQAQGDFERVRCMSLQDVLRAVKTNNRLENELVSMREEKNRLKSSLETVHINLEEEKEKRLCQICLESLKDTICFPCLHLNYCLSCLDKHRTQNNSCPACRTAITGVLRCDLCI